jgi:hypothetical protein
MGLDVHAETITWNPDRRSRGNFCAALSKL